MAVEYKSVIPWGRAFEEYVAMFSLGKNDLSKKIIGCGDGPASFNKHMNDLGFKVVSCDPIYSFSKDQIEQRIFEVKDEVMQQVSNNMGHYIWDRIKNLDELFNLRMSVMGEFLSDFELGKQEGRYMPCSLPELPFKDKEFDIALCSHLLFTFTNLGFDFHYKSIMEMLRVAREIRIFPIIDLNCQRSVLVEPILERLKEQQYSAEIIRVDYEFHCNENEMMLIHKKWAH